MHDFQKASRLFEDRVDRDDYFDAASAEISKTTLLSLIEERERKLLFLLGEPGTGKTKMLHTLKTALSEKEKSRLVVHLNEPFFDPQEFLRKLLKEAGLSENGSLDALKERTTDYFANHEHLIMIDEAQLMSEPSMEFLRILADTKAFRILLSMHKTEGEEILAKPHFKSRSHRVVEIGTLSRDEVKDYIHFLLKKEGFSEIAEMIDGKTAKRIHRYTGGNFRHIKRMVQVLFELIDHAKSNGMRRFSRPTPCLLDMAAIDLELLDA